MSAAFLSNLHLRWPVKVKVDLENTRPPYMVLARGHFWRLLVLTPMTNLEGTDFFIGIVAVSLVLLTVFNVFLQVKVWFQNRRTKQKKDQTKDTDKRTSSTSESLATCNILRLLEQGRLLSVPGPPPNPLLAHPHPGNGSLLGSLSVSTSSGVSSTTTPPGAVAGSGGTFGLSLSSLGGTPPSPRLGVPPPSLCFTMPLLAGAHHELPSGYGCGSSAFEPYSRIERKDGELGGKKTVS